MGHAMASLKMNTALQLNATLNFHGAHNFHTSLLSLLIPYAYGVCVSHAFKQRVVICV